MSDYLKSNMTSDEVINTVSTIKNGTMARLKYKTELPLKAEFAKLGYKMYKIVETTVRFGVNYANISSVIEKKNLSSNEDKDKVRIKRHSNTDWVIKNKILHNNNTDKDYLVFAPMKKGANNKYNFVLVDSTNHQFSFNYWILPEDFKQMVQQNYWTSHRDFHDIKNISIENVIWVGQNKTAK